MDFGFRVKVGFYWGLGKYWEFWGLGWGSTGG